MPIVEICRRCRERAEARDDAIVPEGDDPATAVTEVPKCMW